MAAVAEYPRWSGDPGDMIAQAQLLFLRTRPDGTVRDRIGAPNLATPANMLPLVDAQLAYLLRLQGWADKYAAGKTVADAMAWLPGMWLLDGVVYAMPSASIASEVGRVVKRFQGYRDVLRAAPDADRCTDECVYTVVEPYLSGWHPGEDSHFIADVGMPSLLATGWDAAGDAWAETVTDAVAGLPVDAAQAAADAASTGADAFGWALAAAARLARWAGRHPVATVAIGATVVGGAVAAPYAPLLAAAVRRW